MQYATPPLLFRFKRAMLHALTQFIPQGTSVGWALTALAAGVLVTGIAKSGFGGGIGILAVPLMAGAIHTDAVLGVMLPILIAADIAAVSQHRRFVEPRQLRRCLLGGLVGVVAGTVLLRVYQKASSFSALLSGTVGSVCLLLVAVQLWRFAGKRIPRLPDNRPTAVGVGGLAGLVSTLAHAAGPVMSVYFLDQRMKKRQLVATLAVFFFALNLMKVPGYVALGVINIATLKASALLLPVVPLGALLGLWLHHKVPERPFTLLMYLGAAAAGTRMIFKAFASG
ncbi:MAG: sulfite exporter TauE/SafE family protein [Algisphaera sp.]